MSFLHPIDHAALSIEELRELLETKHAAMVAAETQNHGLTLDLRKKISEVNKLNEELQSTKRRLEFLAARAEELSKQRDAAYGMAVMVRDRLDDLVGLRERGARPTDIRKIAELFQASMAEVGRIAPWYSPGDNVFEKVFEAAKIHVLGEPKKKARRKPASQE